MGELTSSKDQLEPEHAEFVTLEEAMELAEFGNYSDNSLIRMAHACLIASAPQSALFAAKQSRSIVIIEVPAEDWIVPVAMAARVIWQGSSVRTCGVGRAGRLTDVFELLPRHLSGHGLVVVSDTATQAVPKVLRDAAMDRFSVFPPKKSLFLKVARTIVVGDVKSAFKNLEVDGVDFVALCACLVKGDDADNAASKLARVIERVPAELISDDVPSLDRMHGYGMAAEWAKTLKTDVENFRAGRLEWDQVDGAAIMFGQPGVGKSLFARIVAKHCGLPIVATSMADFFLGDGDLSSVLKRQRDAFRRAMNLSPALLFIDEIDALPNRNSRSHNGDFWRPVINDFLLLLDSAVAGKHGIVVLGATNRIMDLDPAILRSRRLGTLLHVPTPDASALVGIFRYHLGADLPDADLQSVARLAVGGTGADVATWVAAARRHARTQSRQMIPSDLVQQVLGDDARSQAYLYRVATHEAGHAVAAVICGVSISSVSIALRDSAAGHTLMQAPSDLMNVGEIDRFVVAILAGRAAEEVLLGEPTAGAGGSATSDLALATRWVRSLHTSFGLKDSLTWLGAPEDVAGRPMLDLALRASVEADLRRLYGLSVGIIMTHRQAALRVIEVLLEEKVIEGTRVAEIVAAQPLDELRS